MRPAPPEWMARCRITLGSIRVTVADGLVAFGSGKRLICMDTLYDRRAGGEEQRRDAEERSLGSSLGNHA